MRHCYWVRPREDPLSWYIVADCLPPRYQMKTRSRLTKKRARGLDISALQHRTAKFAVCQHKLQTKFFFSKTMIFLFSQARIRKFLKGAQVGGGEAWVGGGAGGSKYMFAYWGGGFQSIFSQLYYINLIRFKFLQGRMGVQTRLPRSTHIFPRCFIPESYFVAVIQDWIYFNAIFRSGQCKTFNFNKPMFYAFLTQSSLWQRNG